MLNEIFCGFPHSLHDISYIVPQIRPPQALRSFVYRRQIFDRVKYIKSNILSFSQMVHKPVSFNTVIFCGSRLLCPALQTIFSNRHVPHSSSRACRC
jgi:hypothetical protein